MPGVAAVGVSFNPPPALRPGGTAAVQSKRRGEPVTIRPRRPGREQQRFCNALRDRYRVSIRPRRSGREEPYANRACRQQIRVSIRPRRSGREERAGGSRGPVDDTFQSAPGAQAGRNREQWIEWAECCWFQSAPGAQAGRNETTTAQASQGRRFNPPPALGPGGTTNEALTDVTPPVSIRPRRSGREEPAMSVGLPDPGKFQSAPGAQAGRNQGPRCRPSYRGSFNPPPALRPGGTRYSW